MVKGVYVLLIELLSSACTTVGSLGYLCLDSGVYSYIGSAKGFGGIDARIRRHLSKVKRRLWWHVDYVTALDSSIIRLVIYAESLSVCEEDLVNAILRQRHTWSIAVPRFGSTDRKSPSHLLKCLSNYHACIESVKRAFVELGLEPRELDPALLTGVRG